jgi:hypothetical protein
MTSNQQATSAISSIKFTFKAPYIETVLVTFSYLLLSTSNVFCQGNFAFFLSSLFNYSNKANTVEATVV